MLNRSIFATLAALLVLAFPAAAAAADPTGAVVFSRVVSEGGVEEGGLFAARDGRLNQLTEDPADSQPAFSPDGTTIAFVRDGDVYSVRADGSGQRHLSSGPDLDAAPVFSPTGKFVVFERRAAEGSPGDLYTVRARGGGLRALSQSPEDDHDASFAPDGRAIVFVRSAAETAGGTRDDLFSIRPSGGGLARLTGTSQVDEFEPRYFAGGIVFSRGDSGEGPSAYADVYTMRRNGTKLRSLVAGVGSAYVEDVSPAGRTLLFRRDQGLWVKSTGPGRARKLTELPDGSETNAVFSSDGRRVAAFVATEEAESLSAVDVANGRQVDLAEGVDFSAEAGTTLGPVIAWQPVRPVRR